MRLKSGLQLLNVGHDYFIVDPDGGAINLTNLYSMNETAAFLWQHFSERDFSEADLVECLCGTYDVDPTSAASDVHQLLNTWNEFGLIS